MSPESSNDLERFLEAAQNYERGPRSKKRKPMEEPDTDEHRMLKRKSPVVLRMPM